MKLTRLEKLIIVIEFAFEKAASFARKIFSGHNLRVISSIFACIFSLIVVFHNTAADSLPSCASLPLSTVPEPGVNCLYIEGLPLCRDIVAPEIPDHRVNCADLIDLPLCSDIVVSGSNSAYPGRNCVERCNSSAFVNPDPDDPSLIRGQDYAVFNRDCIRFCDEVDDENVTYNIPDPFKIIANSGNNCIAKKCHQLATDVDPITTGTEKNCDILSCNLLNPHELNKPKFDDASKKYCEGDNVKCYNMKSSQLPYVRVRKQNPLCVLHNCKPASDYCGPADANNVTDKGATYTALYENYVMGGYPIGSNSICVPITCREKVKPKYRCTNNAGIITGNDALDIFRNKACDASGEGANCISNYCYKTIDCNDDSNILVPECRIAAAQVQNINNDNDPFESSFYRPKPMDKAINKSTGLLLPMNHDSDEKVKYCYTMNQMDAVNGWGSHPKFWVDFGALGGFWVDMGFFHDYGLNGEPRSPGACGVSRNGFRGTGYIFLCDTKLSLYQKPAQEAMYFRGYAQTDFSGETPRHKVTVCARYANTLTLNTCGARECGIVAGFGEFWGQNCGDDECVDLYVDDANEWECAMKNGEGMNGSCVERIDVINDDVRIRAVKYNDRICAFMDSKGQTAYNRMFFNGTETLSDGKTCVNDPNSADGCGGYDSNSYDVMATKWRTVLKANYIGNNRPSGPRGYIDYGGKFYPEQECPKVTLRVPPPDLYNIATIVNSNLFSPPLSIRAVSISRGRANASRKFGEIYAKTDFLEPEITVQFGLDNFKMSLGMKETGYENENQRTPYPLAPSTLNFTTTFNGRKFSAELFVRKEDSETDNPLFCLYRKIRDPNGYYLDPLRVACVSRTLPDIE